MTEPATPRIVTRDEWERARAELLVREKAHTRAGDELAAARRRLPMTRMEPVMVVGPNGPVRLHDVFEGRRMLIVYHFMWKKGAPHHQQCEGCTHSQTAMNAEVCAYLAARDVQYAVFSSGEWNEIIAYRDFMGWTPPWYSTADSGGVLATRNGGDLRCYLRLGDEVFETYETKWRGIEAMLPTLQLLDLTPYGRQETWEDSPAGWPQDRAAPGGAATAAPSPSGPAPTQRSNKNVDRNRARRRRPLDRRDSGTARRDGQSLALQVIAERQEFCNV